MKVKVFIVEYQEGTKRKWHHESLSSAVAYALGRELAKRGRKPMIRRIDLPDAQLNQLLVRFEYIASEGRPIKRRSPL